jgi:hypothetical protein
VVRAPGSQSGEAGNKRTTAKWQAHLHCEPLHVFAHTPDNMRGSGSSYTGAVVERVASHRQPHVAWRRRLVGGGLSSTPMGSCRYRKATQSRRSTRTRMSSSQREISPRGVGGCRLGDVERWRWCTNGGADRSSSCAWSGGSDRTCS